MDRIKQLENEIRKHRDLYYNSSPIISDAEFDKLQDELKNIDPKNPVLKQIGAKPKRSKVKNPEILGSLDKISMERFDEWVAKHDDIIVSEKLDGMSIWVEWNKGKIVKAGTRGDGEYGEDVTEKAKLFVPDVNSKIRVIFRGEAILVGDNLYGYKNRRNAVAGILNRDDIEMSRKLKVKFYDVIKSDISSNCDFKFIESLDLPVAWWKFVTHKEKLHVGLDKMMKNRPTNYDIDGYVLESNGEKIAYKQSSEAVETIVKSIRWKVSRTGRIKPVIVVEPIHIGGIEIRHATAFNAKYISDNKLGIHSKVKIVRANEVIPYITEIVAVSDLQYAMIGYCPSCGTKLKIDGVDLVCNNNDCKEMNVLRLTHYLINLGVEGISAATLRKLKIYRIEDLYDRDKVNVENLKRIEGLGTVIASRIVDEIDKTLITTPTKLLAAFAVSNFSEKMADRILSKYKFFEIFDLTVSKLLNIEGIAEKKADTFVAEIGRWKDVYKFLCKRGLRFMDTKKTDKLNGVSICITGTLSSPRKEFEKTIVDNGGRLCSMSKKLDYLVTGKNPTGHKVEKAKVIGIKVIDEKELLNLLK